MLSRPSALPDFNFLMAASSSSTVKSDDRLASAVAALESEVTSREVQHAKFLSASGKRALFRSCEAIAFAVTGHLECVVLLPVSLCMVCHALRLECVKSTDSTTSISPPGPAYFIQLCVDVFLGGCLLVLTQEVVAAVVPSGDAVSVEAAWDVLLRCAYKHVAIRCVCVWRPRRQLVNLGDLVFFFQFLR